jgi:hypothetical protein
MDRIDYVKMFDLKPHEYNRRILICAAKELQPELPDVEFIDPKTFLHLPFTHQSFDLVLCPNVLFIDQHNDAQSFYQEVLTELARVGAEVRVLPLVNQAGKPAQYLGSIIQSLQERGLGVELRQIQIKIGAEINAMLRVWNTVCVVK